MESLDIGNILLQLQNQLERNKFYQFEPYPWQKEFYAAGSTYMQRMMCAANRVGKSYSAAFEIACHATQNYPEWWTGKRFDKRQMLIWTGAVTAESSRDIIQKELFGGVGEAWGTGMIPKDMLIGNPKMRQAGISDVMDVAEVRNKSGGVTRIILKSYEQGWRKWQGTAPDVVWLDEEPEDYKLFTEALTRLATTKGIMLVTFTPLLGMTHLVEHFMSEKSGAYFKNVGWDDAPHLDEATKNELLNAYPEWERDSRTRGVPMLGEGRVFNVNENDFKIDPFKIPEHFARIVGIDFGMEHPAAASWIAWDRDADIVYIYDCYKRAKEQAAYHAHAINSRGKWIPVAWPHDGMNTEKGSGKQLCRIYQEHGVNMLPISARYDRDTGGGQPTEPIVMEITERIRQGRFKVFSTCTPFFEEFRTYHRKNGKINPVKDDVLKATFYGTMMLRYARPETIRRVNKAPTMPILTSRG